MNFKSKITWIQLISLIIAVLGAIQPTFPDIAVYLVMAVNILTVILRQLQGKEVTIAGNTIKL